MNNFTQDMEARLLELLGKELEMLKQIRELTKKQTELLSAEDGNSDAFDSSLDRRQGLIEKINGLHQESDVLMQSYVSSSGPGGKRGAIDELSARIYDVLAECASLNEKNMVVAKAKAEEYVNRIGNLSIKRKSLGAYSQSVPNNSELFDKKT